MICWCCNGRGVVWSKDGDPDSLYFCVIGPDAVEITCPECHGNSDPDPKDDDL